MRHASPFVLQPQSDNASDPSRLPTLRAIADTIVACQACPRLRTYCTLVGVTKKRAHAGDTYWARPVPGFGDPSARVLLIGLAPAAHGANRTGRVFTGDSAGGSSDFLMSALHRAGFASQPVSRALDDGLALHDAYIAMAVRCAPPANTPTPAELARCLPYLDAEAAGLPNVRVVIGLGRVAFDAWIRVCQRRGIALPRRPAFGHGQVVRMGHDTPVLLGCFHPSRQNTNTGRLTPTMLATVLRQARRLAQRPSRP